MLVRASATKEMLTSLLLMDEPSVTGPFFDEHLSSASYVNSNISINTNITYIKTMSRLFPFCQQKLGPTSAFFCPEPNSRTLKIY